MGRWRVGDGDGTKELKPGGVGTFGVYLLFTIQCVIIGLNNSKERR